MQLFYFGKIEPNQSSIELPKDETRHISRVLRKKQGDQIHITDGNGRLFLGTIMSITSTKCVVNLAFAKAESQPTSSLHIAIAPTKMNDRMEWFLEKATEMGIARITPILCDHSERKKINLERFEKIVVSAMKQSNRLFLPVLDELTDFREFLLSTHGSRLIAHCEEDGEKSELINELQPHTCLLIGPEGDFSNEEIELAKASGFKPVSLGPTRLRTETAGVYAAAIFNATKLN
ncbi:16S rRNA (uracil(1498)-N(3))-methyltransferase [Nonlabens tegetincola]|uniref:16S rRNA (uracil(1498)-N(3))-methyltransferase n=1 Tax=Nonlabens tegetincola TaxID=323273 RepID=UPI0030C8ADF3